MPWVKDAQCPIDSNPLVLAKLHCCHFLDFLYLFVFHYLSLSIRCVRYARFVCLHAAGAPKQEMCSKAFGGKELSTTMNADECVARGLGF